jgi:integrase
MSRRSLPAAIFKRDQGGHVRFYARVDGGRRVALCPQGSTRATSDPEVAVALYTQLVAAEQKRTLRSVHGLPLVEMTLEAAAAEHLRLKAVANKVTTQSLEADQRNLERACEFLGADTLLEAITPQRVGEWAAHLLSVPVAPRLPEGKKRGKRPPRVMGPSNARKCLNSLSNLYRRGAEQGWCTFNPVAALMSKPQGRARESRWFEAHEVALLIESARTLSRKRSDLAAGCAHELVATAALTGARPGELLALTAEDVSFDRNMILIRGTKTAGAFRSVPLHPQLREILRPYICGLPPRTGLLFRSPKTGGRLKDARKLLDAVATRVGFAERAVNLYAFRHSYCAARLQTLDRGAPVSPYTVGRELGHGGDALVRRVYGHLGETRHRADVVEYRVEQHAAKLQDRLAALHAADSENDSVLNLGP